MQKLHTPAPNRKDESHDIVLLPRTSTSTFQQMKKTTESTSAFSAGGGRISRRTGAAASGEEDPVLRSRGVQQARLLPTAGLGSSLPKPHSQGLTLQKAGEISPVISGNSKHPLFSGAVQTDKAVARAPNPRELGEPLLKHTIVATLT